MLTGSWPRLPPSRIAAIPLLELTLIVSARLLAPACPLPCIARSLHALRLQDQLHWTRTRVLIVERADRRCLASLPLVLHAQAPLLTVLVAVASVSLAILLWVSCWTLAPNGDARRVAHVITNLGIGGPQGWTIRCAAEADAGSFDCTSSPAPLTTHSVSTRARRRYSCDRLHLVPELGRAVAPRSDPPALSQRCSAVPNDAVRLVHTHMTKAGVCRAVSSRSFLTGTPVDRPHRTRLVLPLLRPDCDSCVSSTGSTCVWVALV